MWPTGGSLSTRWQTWTSRSSTRFWTSKAVCMACRRSMQCTRCCTMMGGPRTLIPAPPLTRMAWNSTNNKSSCWLGPTAFPSGSGAASAGRARRMAPQVASSPTSTARPSPSSTRAAARSACPRPRSHLCRAHSPAVVLGCASIAGQASPGSSTLGRHAGDCPSRGRGSPSTIMSAPATWPTAWVGSASWPSSVATMLPSRHGNRSALGRSWASGRACHRAAIATSPPWRPRGAGTARAARTK
mmetsp:Transcript_45422/g.126401  ORF Transcript_45422/g.126401 Transcript_45422/m.126401 type:complete len:243 (+) Transcript_45422:548-1276(+)